MDRAEVWATNLPPAYGLVPARGGVIVACAPDIVYLADRDGDGRAEICEKLFTGFATGALERGINAPQWGVDGWIYFGRGWGGGEITGPHLNRPVRLPGSDFRIRADGSAIEPVTGGTHTFGFAMTETGDRFIVTTTIPAIYVAPLPWRYLVRNPNAAASNIESPSGDRRAYSISKPHPWRQKRADNPAYFKYYNSRYGAAESEADGWFTAACGPMIYHDRVLPGLHGQYFVCEPSGNLIHRAQIEEDGSALRIRRVAGEEKSEFAASSDSWSHPMNLMHGPDGSIWVVDYYREIIEDYSAIPRHLQQQYGVYNGHDRGRIYRLTHRHAPPTPPSDMSQLDSAALAKECASPLLWRRQTAQRLLVERGEKSAAPALRKILHDKTADALAIVTVLRTLDQLDALAPVDVEPFIRHEAVAVRVHALQLADRWLATDEGNPLLNVVLDGAQKEQHPRAQIQLALSLGEARDPRALAMLAQFARDRLSVQWMDATILSSIGGRGAEMLIELSTKDRASETFINALKKTISAARSEPKSAGEKQITASTNIPPVQHISDATFREYVAALSRPRDLKRGHELFLQACAICHRIGKEGNEVGPDLIGQLGMAEEALLKEILTPNDRIRPGFETTIVELAAGGNVLGILKDDGATSLTVAQPNGAEEIILRKDATMVRRVANSLMPSFVETLKPADVANLLAWLRSNLGSTSPQTLPPAK
jgi:putative membrane-bound dehydrogenase-like protein